VLSGEKVIIFLLMQRLLKNKGIQFEGSYPFLINTKEEKIYDT